MKLAEFEEPSRLQSQLERQTLGRSHVGALTLWTKVEHPTAHCWSPPTWGGNLLIPGVHFFGVVGEGLSRIQLKGRLTDEQPVGNRKASVAQVSLPFSLRPLLNSRTSTTFSTSRPGSSEKVEMPRDSHSPGIPNLFLFRSPWMPTTHSILAQSAGRARTAMGPLLRIYYTPHPVTRPDRWQQWKNLSPFSDRIARVTLVWRPVAALFCHRIS